METTTLQTPTAQVSKGVLWTSRLLSAIPVLVVLLGSVMKLMKSASVIQGFAHAGLSGRLVVPAGLIELTCVIVYLVPSTSVLGAILLTGLLGWGYGQHAAYRRPDLSPADPFRGDGVERAVRKGPAVAGVDSATSAGEFIVQAPAIPR